MLGTLDLAAAFQVLGLQAYTTMSESRNIFNTSPNILLKDRKFGVKVFSVKLLLAF